MCTCTCRCTGGVPLHFINPQGACTGGLQYLASVCCIYVCACVCIYEYACLLPLSNSIVRFYVHFINPQPQQVLGLCVFIHVSCHIAAALFIFMPKLRYEQLLEWYFLDFYKMDFQGNCFAYKLWHHLCTAAVFGAQLVSSLTEVLLVLQKASCWLMECKFM